MITKDVIEVMLISLRARRKAAMVMVDCTELLSSEKFVSRAYRMSEEVSLLNVQIKALEKELE